MFRRGGKIKNNEKWWFDGTPIEVVDFYKYLGVLFTSNLNWSMCKKHYHYKLKKDFICSIDTVINVVFYPGQLLLHCLIKLVYLLFYMGRKCGALNTQNYVNRFSMIFAEELQVYRIILAN